MTAKCGRCSIFYITLKELYYTLQAVVFVTTVPVEFIRM